MFVRSFFLLAPWLCASAIAQQTSMPRPSSLLQSALEGVARASSAVDLNHWKGPTAVRNEVDGNLLSIQKDLQSALPPLLTAADAAPESVAASLPVLLNLDALYSVLIRVAVAAHSYAPRDQSAALDGSAAILDSARRDLGDTLLASARANEKRVEELQAKVRDQAATLAASQQAPPSAAPAKKTKASRGRPSSSATPSN